MKKYKTIIIVTLLIAMCVVYYYYITTNKKAEKSKTTNNLSEVEKIINKDLDNSYPATPREVVNFYSRLLSCYYGAKYDDDQFTSIALQSRKLFDEELLNQNSYDEYLENLKADIKQYKEEGKKVSTYIIEKSGDIEYKTFKSHYYAKVDCVYYIKGEGGTSRTLETYTLRKDSTGKWKILYWSLTETENEDE